MNITNIHSIKRILPDTYLTNLAKKIYDKLYRNKLKRIYKKYKRTGNLPYPDTVFFELTFRCNLHCKMCYINFDSMRKIKELDTRQIKNVLGKLPRGKTIVLTGGEILLRQDIFEILDFLQEKGAQVQLATNAVLITEDIANKLAEYKNIVGVGTSIDGVSELHDTIRGQKGAFKRAIGAIKLLAERGLFVTVTSVIMKDNLPYLSDIIKACKVAGAKYIALEFERLTTGQVLDETAKTLDMSQDSISVVARNALCPDYTFDELKSALESAEKTSGEVNMPIYYLPALFRKRLRDYYTRSVSGPHFCRYLFTCRIDAGGNVVFCYALRKNFGNLLEKSFEEIWNSTEFKEFRKKLDGKILPICETCEKLICLHE